LTLNFKIRRFLGLKTYNLEISLSELVFKPVKERVISVLKRLADKFGVCTKEPDFVKINIPLTHQILADMAGSSRETVSKIIGELKDKGLLKTERRYILIKRDLN
jgi:CRP/FNR family transcriptional regulator